MPTKPKPVPEGTHTITAHLAIRNAEKALEFYPKAFGAEIIGGVAKGPDGKIMHAELKIGDSKLMLHDEMPSMGAPGPETLGGTPITLSLCVEDVDTLWNRAVAAGAKITMPLQDQFWGDRYGVVSDPFGYKWAMLSHIEDVAEDEMKRRMDAFFAKAAQQKTANA